MCLGCAVLSSKTEASYEKAVLEMSNEGYTTQSYINTKYGE